MGDYERTRKTSWLKRIFSNDDSYEYEDIVDERLYPAKENYTKSSDEQSEDEQLEETDETTFETDDHTDKKPSFENTFGEKSDDILMKDNQDKVTLDSIIALENLLKDRQLILHGYKNIKEKLKIATDEIDQAKNENEHQQVLINEKDRIIQKRDQDIAEQQAVLWNIDTEDWKHRDPEKILNSIKEQDPSGSIILMHENEAVVAALPSIIEHLQQQELEMISIQ